MVFVWDLLKIIFSYRMGTKWSVNIVSGLTYGFMSRLKWDFLLKPLTSKVIDNRDFLVDFHQENEFLLPDLILA